MVLPREERAMTGKRYSDVDCMRLLREIELQLSAG